MVALARAVQQAGHEVVVVSGPGFRDVVVSNGFEFIPAGIDGPTAISLYNRTYPQAKTIDPLEESQLIITGMFVEFVVPAVLADASQILDWRPDVIVREEGEFAGPVLAAMAGVPCVDHSWGPVRPMSLVTTTAEALRGVWKRACIERPPLAGFYESLYLDVCPPSLQFPEANDIAVLQRMATATGASAPGEALPRSMASVRDRGAVYVTLGTVPRYNNDVAFFRTAIEGLSDLDIDIVVTVGPTGDPESFGPQPSHVHIERFIAQDAILPYCKAAITNGGSGSMMGALANGVPLLCVPAASPSQLRNTDAVVRAHAGRSLPRDEATPHRIRSDVRSLLDEPSYRRAAGYIAEEMRNMPPLSDVVTTMEKLVNRRRVPRG
jgi:UDP:flavonoid glycosyltransferase YjiC (YdhE family)